MTGARKFHSIEEILYIRPSSCMNLAIVLKIPKTRLSYKLALGLYSIQIILQTN